MVQEKMKRLWASLFPSKPCRCACGDPSSLHIEREESNNDTCHGECVREIKVLGPGCAKCKSTFKTLEKVIRDNGLDVRLQKVENIEEIMRYNVLATPAVVVDGNVVTKGKVPTEAEAKRLLGL